MPCTHVSLYREELAADYPNKPKTLCFEGNMAIWKMIIFIVAYVPGRGFFRAILSQNREKLQYPPPLFVERLCTVLYCTVLYLRYTCIHHARRHIKNITPASTTGLPNSRQFPSPSFSLVPRIAVERHNPNIFTYSPIIYQAAV